MLVSGHNSCPTHQLQPGFSHLRFAVSGTSSVRNTTEVDSPGKTLKAQGTAFEVGIFLFSFTFKKEFILCIQSSESKKESTSLSENTCQGPQSPNVVLIHD